MRNNSQDVAREHRRSRHHLNAGVPYGDCGTRPAPPHTGTNGFAITALILGLVGGSILAVIFGHIAKAQIRRTGEQGNGLATAGLIVGYAGTALLAIVLISMIVAAVSYRGY